MEKKVAERRTISLCMIVKNEEKNLPVVLASAKDFVDEIVIIDTGSTDKTKEVVESYGAKVYDFEWVDDFGAARNFSFSKATKEWILWLDADDKLDGGDKIQDLLAALSPSIGGVMAEYYYAFDDVGNCVAEHRKVRLCKNDGTFIWKGRIHEDLVPVGAIQIMGTPDFSVYHLAKGDRVGDSSRRNLTIAKLEYAEKPKDPRVVWNLANAHTALAHWNDAIKCYLEYVSMSEWDEEIYLAWCRMAHCLMQMQNFDEAMNMYLRAVKIKPKYTEAFRGLAHCAVFKGDLPAGEEFMKMTLMKEKPDSAIVWNPFEYEVAPYYELAQIYANMNKIDDALFCIEKYIDKSKGKQNGKDLKKQLDAVKKDLDFRESYINAAKYLDEEEKIDDLKNLLAAVPVQFKSDPALTFLRNKHFARKESSGRDIAIWCGMAWEEWGPSSLEKGIGGSEEAVIRLAREWAKDGWCVTVFNNCGAEEIWDVVAGHGSPGQVVYRPFWEFNVSDKYDVFISWRAPNIFDHKINAPVKLLDLHDVPALLDYPTKRLNEMTKIMFKTNFHRQLLPNVGKDKVAVIPHGVDATEFEKNVPRNRKRICYTSSYDRGLEHLLDIWPLILKDVPDAELHIAYGWDMFDKICANNKERMAWKETMQVKMEQEGVFDHGRLSHQEVADLMLSSGIFAYPSDFAEIFCIAAAKAQVAGCVPIVAVSANCMRETVKIGVTITGDIKKDEAQERFAAETIKMLKDEDLQQKVGTEARNVAREAFDWGKTAREWEKLFTV